MSLSKEELLKPRFEIIADYPENIHYPIGKIIILQEDETATNENGYPVKFCHFDLFPHLFSSLPWWEKRALHDMPEYIRCEFHFRNVVTGTCLKAKWERPYKGLPNILYRGRDTNDYWIDARYFSPITEQEYLAYMSSKHGNK